MSPRTATSCSMASHVPARATISSSSRRFRVAGRASVSHATPPATSVSTGAGPPRAGPTPPRPRRAPPPPAGRARPPARAAEPAPHPLPLRFLGLREKELYPLGLLEAPQPLA